MQKQTYILEKIENNQEISSEKDSRFLFLLKIGLLNALLEKEMITEEHHTRAIEFLRRKE